jgi:hypothetical protein
MKKRIQESKEHLVVDNAAAKAAGEAELVHLVELEERQEAKVTPLYKVPLLTEEQINNLLTMPDHGVQPAAGIGDFPTFESWIKGCGIRGRNN